MKISLSQVTKSIFALLFVSALALQATPILKAYGESEFSMVVEDAVNDSYSQAYGGTFIDVSLADVEYVEIYSSSEALKLSFYPANTFPPPGPLEGQNMYINYGVTVNIEIGLEGDGIILQIDSVVMSMPGMSLQQSYITLEGPWGSISSSGAVEVSEERLDIIFTSNTIGQSYLESLRDAFENRVSILVDAEFSIMVSDQYMQVGQVAVDEIDFVEQPESEYTTTYTGTETTEYPPVDTTTYYDEDEPFYSQLEPTTTSVSVEFRSEPVFSISLEETSEEYIITYKLEAEGSSSNASHVAVAIEVYYLGKLVGQTAFNTNIGPDSQADPDRSDGFYSEFTTSSPGGVATITFKAALMPSGEGDWSSWKFELLFQQRVKKGVPTSGLNELERKLIEDPYGISTDDVKIVLIAIGFTSLDESSYNIAKAETTPQISVGGEETTTTTTTETVGEETKTQKTEKPGDARTETTMTEDNTTKEQTSETGETPREEDEGETPSESGGDEGIPVSIVAGAAAAILLALAGAAYFLLRNK
ncbi:MAG: hypothetical protein F7C09_05655 [Aeropyrum sp.]|nr:hypothetical protein [Aeropyrum sp.]